MTKTNLLLAKLKTTHISINNQSKSDALSEIAMIEVDVLPLCQSGVAYRNYAIGHEGRKWCITNPFSINGIISKSENMVILSAGDPHQGYTIYTQMKGGRLNGNATIQSPNIV